MLVFAIFLKCCRVCVSAGRITKIWAFSSAVTLWGSVLNSFRYSTFAASLSVVQCLPLPACRWCRHGSSLQFLHVYSVSWASQVKKNDHYIRISDSTCKTGLRVSFRLHMIVSGGRCCCFWS